MARGPKPKPAAVKRAQGNPGKRAIGADPAPEAAQAIGVEPPSWLKDEGLAVWARIAPRVIALRLLTSTDRETFGRYCRNFARWLKMQAALDEAETYTVQTASGLVHRAKPEFLIADRLERQLLAAEDRFGLNPAERQRLFAARAASPDPAAGELNFGKPAATPAQPTSPTKPAAPLKGPIGLLN